MENKNVYAVAKSVLINAPVPESTRTYKSFSNQQLIDNTLEGIHQAGFTLDKEFYSSAKEGLVANGRYTIKDVADDEMQLQITWRNSYNKTLPLTFSIGAMILVCSNGMQKSMGMGSFKKKHQGEIQSYTPTAISEYIKGSQEIFKQMQIEREQMKQIALSRTLQADIIGRMFIEAEFIKSTQLNIIKRELDNPTHSYGDPNSLWSLYQYTTFAMREIHPSLYLQDHIDAHNFFTTQAGIIVPMQTINVTPVEDKRQLSWLDEIVNSPIEESALVEVYNSDYEDEGRSTEINPGDEY